MKESIFIFIENMWGLTPQPVKSEFKAFVDLCINLGDYTKVKKEHFEKFTKGEHITWQQFLILSSYQRALNKEDKKESHHNCPNYSPKQYLVVILLFNTK